MPRMVSPDPAPTTLGAALRYAVQTAPDRPLLRMAEGEWTTAALDAQSDRVAHVVKACFNGRRIVVFSGGAAKGADAVYQDARDIRDGGGNGSIIGRNSFQRPRDEALALLDRIVRIYLNKE